MRGFEFPKKSLCFLLIFCDLGLLIICVQIKSYGFQLDDVVRSIQNKLFLFFKAIVMSSHVLILTHYCCIVGEFFWLVDGLECHMFF